MSTLKKIFKTGNGIRNAIADFRDIKITDYLAQQASRGKEEFTKILASEIKKFLGQINLHEEIRKALTGLTVDLEARIHLSTAHTKENPKASFSVRRSLRHPSASKGK